ncbi:MAG: hypothetical protein H7067_15535 [Burkholderiales bacterium]|nr:hypothetical protein [Opitutaceae bacterium]
MSFDFSRWAVVAYNDDTGLGRMAQDIKAVLGVRQLVVPSQRLSTRSLVAGRDHLLRDEASTAELEAALGGLDGLVLLEKADWHPQLPSVARRLGVRLACVPMWEWFRGTDAVWATIDVLLCPSKFCRQVVHRYGWRNTVDATWPLDLTRLPARRIGGGARVFFHNAGLVDDDDRKGTRDTIRAFHRLACRDVRLIVRLQRAAPLPELDERIDVRIGNLESPGALYTEGEVAVQPSKMEGVGFMVLEPVCSGVPTITTDYPPMSDHVVQPELRVQPRWFKRTCFPARAAAVSHAHLRLPRLRDLTRRMTWCVEHDLAAISLANRARAEQLFDPARLRDEWRRALAPSG